LQRQKMKGRRMKDEGRKLFLFDLRTFIVLFHPSSFFLLPLLSLSFTLW
jgi:hypothetical protein